MFRRNFMKYRCLLSVLVALGFSSWFCAIADATAGNYQEIYAVFSCGGTAGINAAFDFTFNFFCSILPSLTFTFLIVLRCGYLILKNKTFMLYK